MPFNSIFSWMMKRRINQIDLFKENPLQIQFKTLTNLLKDASFTEFGKKYDFNNISTLEQYKNNVPLQDYESLKPYIERIINGERQILWHSTINWFAKSSGTTSSKSKYIPVSKESLQNCHYKGGKDLLALYYNNFPNRKLYNGKHLIIGGSTEINVIDSNSYFGDLSAIIVKNLPFWAEIRRTPSQNTTLLADWEEKIEKMIAETINEDIYIIAGVPSWTQLILEKTLEKTGKKHIKEVWPNLELFLHGGVNFEPYRENFKKLIPSDEMNYLQTYNATEGFFGIQDQVDSDELLLMLDYGIYYEFIKTSDFDGVSTKKTHTLSEVQLNINYALVISANNGLWRYILGDTIEFTNIAPYRFKITGRTKQFINVFGEEIIVENAENSLAKACEITNCSIQEYTAGPVYLINGEKGKHEWLIEFKYPPENIAHFAKILDDELKKSNSDYEAKRFKNLLLEQLEVKPTRNNAFSDWLKDNGKLGGQHKIPRLSNDRKFIEEMYKYL